MTADENDVVMDPFCGGGSAAVASRQMGRRYIGCDIDSHCAEVANKKYKKASSSKEINGEYVSVHLGQPVSMRHVDIMQ